MKTLLEIISNKSKMKKLFLQNNLHSQERLNLILEQIIMRTNSIKSTFNTESPSNDILQEMPLYDENVTMFQLFL